MGTNTGRGFRRGAVRGRSQLRNPLTRMWVKRDSSTGRFLDGKTSGGRFKGVRRENRAKLEPRWGWANPGHGAQPQHGPLQRG
jgi:hypothetical protein